MSDFKNINRLVGRRIQWLINIGFQVPEELRTEECIPTYEAYLLSAGQFVDPLLEGISPHGFRAAVHSSLMSLDELIASVSQGDDGIIACRVGCNACCHLRVTVTAPVVLALSFYLKKKLDESQLADLIYRMKQYLEATNVLTPTEAIRPRGLCPLNVDGKCIGYEYRPYSCRSHHSFDRSKCEQARDTPLIDVSIPQNPTRNDVQLLTAAPARQISSLMGWNCDELEFIPALLIALENDAAMTQYLQGGNPLEAAHQPEILEAQLAEARRLGNSIPTVV